MADRLAEELRALADVAEVRELDVPALRGRVDRDRRRRRVAGGLAVLLVAGAAVPVVRLLGDEGAPDRLASGPASEPAHVRVVSREVLEGTGGLPAGVDACLEAGGVTEVVGELGVVLRLDGTAAEQAAVVDCLRAVDGVRVLPQSGPEARPVFDLRAGTARLTPEQVSRAGVDATAECSVPGVRESAPPFEGEPPLASAELLAGYLTDQHGHAEWTWEYDGSLSFGDQPLTDQLVRLCWYAGGGEYQLVVSAVGGGPRALPNSSARGPRPFPILAPPPPRSLSAAEVARRSVVFPQPEGLVRAP